MTIPFSRLLSIVAIPVLVVSLFAGIYYFKQTKGTIDLPDYGAVPVFKLTDTSGVLVDSASLLGKPYILSFLFTRCPDQCPLMVAKLAKLSKRFPNLRFVSITADPDFDTPKVLAEYVDRGIGPRNWSFLTGEKEALKDIALGFMTAAPDNPGLHSTRFILIDTNGRIRGFYDSQSREQLGALAVDVQSFLD